MDNDAINSALIERLAGLETAGLSDVLDEMGFSSQVLASDLRPLDPDCRLAGVAFCVRGENRIITQSQSTKSSFSPYELERAMRPGLIAVIDAGPQNVGGMIGGFVATSLKSKGCRGLVTNGGVRDSREIVSVGLPTFCRFVTPVNASRRWSIADVGQPVQLPGLGGGTVAIQPGDYLLGDADGVIVVPAAIIVAAIEAAETLDAIEKKITQGIRDGGTREELFQLHPRFAHIQRLKP